MAVIIAIGQREYQTQNNGNPAVDVKIANAIFIYVENGVQDSGKCWRATLNRSKNEQGEFRTHVGKQSLVGDRENIAITDIAEDFWEADITQSTDFLNNVIKPIIYPDLVQVQS